jgi:CheY-like chemotaxis protein
MARGGLYEVGSLRGVYVLVVDADPDGRLFIQTILRYCGAYARPAASAREALELMKQMVPDAIVVDLGTDHDFSLIRRIRSLKPESGGMVGAIALGDHAQEEPARSRGFDAFMAKPLTAWDLCRLVLRVTTG